jgi:hypothetical protein
LAQRKYGVEAFVMELLKKRRCRGSHRVTAEEAERHTGKELEIFLPNDKRTGIFGD